MALSGDAQFLAVSCWNKMCVLCKVEHDEQDGSMTLHPWRVLEYHRQGVQTVLFSRATPARALLIPGTEKEALATLPGRRFLREVQPLGERRLLVCGGKEGRISVFAVEPSL